jgi:hypothetical protein
VERATEACRVHLLIYLLHLLHRHTTYYAGGITQEKPSSLTPSIYQVLSIIGHLRGFLLNLEGTRVPRIRASVVRHLNHAQTRINTGSNASFRVRVRYQRHPQ